MNNKSLSRGKVGFVVITYNPDKQKFRRIIDSLVGNSVIVVDNTPSPAIVIPEDVDYLHPKDNIGFAKGANEGIGFLQDKTEWIVTMVQDVDFDKAAVSDFCTRLVEMEPAIVGPYPGQIDRKRWSTVLLDILQPVDYVSGSFIAVHTKVFESVGKFYEPYFMYYEDVDLCVRAKNKGFPIISLPLHGVKHKDSESLGKGSYNHMYYLARNHLLFVERLAPVSVKIRETVRFPKTLYEHVIHGEKGATKGMQDYLFRKFGRL